METKQAIFDRLIEEALPMLRNTAYGILGNAADADDAVQEALVKAWKKYTIFHSRSKLSSWVCRITINVAYDMLRQRKRETETMDQYIPDDGRHDESQLQALEHAVAELPETFRLPLVMVCFSGVSTEDAAKQLGCSLNAFYWRISRAKQMLREKMKGM